jgi:DNA processing protein
MPFPWEIPGRVTTIAPPSPTWPTALNDLSDPPSRIYLLGQIPRQSPRIAIVGTRRACVRGRHFARNLAADLAAAGCVIVSGGAEGIDAEAHLGALDVRGPTLAVLGTAVERPFPSKHAGIFAEVCTHGGLLSETARDGPTFRASFVRRNRLIAALADAVVVVQAPFKSGAMSTAAFARRLERPLLVVPASPWDPRGEGCLALLAQGAKICRSATDVLSLAAPSPGTIPARSPGRPEKRKRIQHLDADEQALVAALAVGEASVDELCVITGLDAARVQRATLMLMLSRTIQEVGGGRYACTDHP